MKKRASLHVSPATAGMLTLAPLLWAGNAVVGRLVRDLVSPLTLNFLRWFLALALLLPFAVHVLHPNSGLWPHWRRYALLGLFGIGCFNALQYLALQSSTPINVTLVGSSIPLWMLTTGALFFGRKITRREIVAALLSLTGVLLVLSRGQWQQLLALRLVPGDLYMVAATISWALYSWMLVRTHQPEQVRGDWAALLTAQLLFGVGWSGIFAAGEWMLDRGHLDWQWPLVAALVFIALGPAIVAYRCWGIGVQRAGPATAAFFTNLTPLFAALLSALFLHELPHLYHVVALVLIVTGIWISSKK